MLIMAGFNCCDCGDQFVVLPFKTDSANLCYLNQAKQLDEALSFSDCDSFTDLESHISIRHMGWFRFECLLCQPHPIYKALTKDELQHHHQNKHKHSSFKIIIDMDLEKQTILNEKMMLSVSGRLNINQAPSGSVSSPSLDGNRHSIPPSVSPADFVNLSSFAIQQSLTPSPVLFSSSSTSHSEGHEPQIEPNEPSILFPTCSKVVLDCGDKISQPTGTAIIVPKTEQTTPQRLDNNSPRRSSFDGERSFSYSPSHSKFNEEQMEIILSKAGVPTLPENSTIPHELLDVSHLINTMLTYIIEENNWIISDQMVLDMIGQAKRDCRLASDGTSLETITNNVEEKLIRDIIYQAWSEKIKQNAHLKDFVTPENLSKSLVRPYKKYNQKANRRKRKAYESITILQ